MSRILVYWTATKQPKVISGRSLAKMRRTRMENRIRKKAPLLADQLIEAELKKRPEFYCPIECEKRQQKRKKQIERMELETDKRWIPGTMEDAK